MSELKALHRKWAEEKNEFIGRWSEEKENWSAQQRQLARQWEEERQMLLANFASDKAKLVEQGGGERSSWAQERTRLLQQVGVMSTACVVVVVGDGCEHFLLRMLRLSVSLCVSGDLYRFEFLSP